MKSRSLIVLFLLLFTVSCCLMGQTFRGSIQGTVTDSSGAAVVGAQVKVASPATGLSRSTSTGNMGEYVVSELPLGSYSVTISKEGFRTMTLTSISVSVGTPQRADAKLTPGQVAEHVEVTAEVPLVETSTNTMGGTIEASQAEELPVNGRDFTKLLSMVAGATGDPVGSTDSPGSYGLFSVNGSRGRSNNYLIDGTDMNDSYRNLPSINQAGVYGTPATLLPVDALAEIPVISGADAEFGRNSGAIVNLVTKSGTNQIHGSFYEYFRNDALGARNFFNTADQPKNTFLNHQFGGSAGGPFVKDKSFWYAAYEGQREDGSLPQAANAPTDAQISQAIADNGGVVNPVIQKILDLNPWRCPSGGCSSSGFLPVPFNNTIDSFIGKIDQHLHLLSPTDLLTGRYFFGNSNQSFPLALASAGGYNTYSPVRVNILSLSYTTMPSTNLVIELRGGFNRYHEDFLAQDRTFNPGSIGLDTLPAGATSVDYGLPLIVFEDGTGSVGATTSDPRGRVDDNWQGFGNVSYTHGSHNWKFGYEYRRTFVKSFFDTGYRGKLKFANLDAFIAGTPDGGAAASPDPSNPTSKRYTYQNSSGLYAQDSWRVTPRLTLNYGIRWDYFGVLGEEYNRFTLFDPTANGGNGGLVPVGGAGGPSTLYPKDYKNFAPRVGFTYDLTGKGRTVVRASYGMFYDAYSQDFFIGQIPYNAYNPGVATNTFGYYPGVTGLIQDSVPVFSGFSFAYDLWTVDPKLTTPYLQNYNLNVEHQITSNLAFQVGYVGSIGRNLFRFRDINQGPPGGPHPWPDFEYINQVETTASSSFNSLQASLRIRNWHGLTSTLNYTWGHSIDNASDGSDYVPNAAQPDNSANPSAERASSNFDTRHRIEWLWTYQIPKFGGATWITKGWALDGTFIYSTGQPFNVSYLYEADYNGTGEWFGRPDINRSLVYSGTGGMNLLNQTAFTGSCGWDNTAGGCVSGSEHFGNTPRNAFRGPNYTDVDFSISKTTKLREWLTMQLRADFFNLFNHPNFTNPLMPNFGTDVLASGVFVPGTVAGCPVGHSCGQIVGSGYLQPTATPDVATGNPFLGGGGPRNIELAVRFSF